MTPVPSTVSGPNPESVSRRCQAVKPEASGQASVPTTRSAASPSMAGTDGAVSAAERSTSVWASVTEYSGPPPVVPRESRGSTGSPTGWVVLTTERCFGRLTRPSRHAASSVQVYTRAPMVTTSSSPILSANTRVLRPVDARVRQVEVDVARSRTQRRSEDAVR